jgi:hypothetical protein
MDHLSHEVSNDRFGLPPFPSKPETARERVMRQALVRRNGELALRELFVKLRFHLNEDEARRLFVRCSPRRKPLHQGRGVSDPERDRRLLDLYDLVAETQPRKAVRMVAEHFDNSEPGRFGNSVKAIERHIRRLVDSRIKAQAGHSRHAGDSDSRQRLP